MEGGEAGDEGPPLEVFGGLMRFSFCRLLKNIDEKEMETLIGIYSERGKIQTYEEIDLPVAKPYANHLFFHIETISHICDFF